MPHGRITVRLPNTLVPLLAACIGHGRTALDIIREALELYLGGCQTERPAPQLSPRALPIETLQAIAAGRQELAQARLDDVAQVLVACGIYRGEDATTGHEKPVNRGTRKKRLARARAAGLL
jgi:hypothetical protein